MTAEGVASCENFRRMNCATRTSPSTPPFSLDDDNQIEAANQYIAIARAGPIFPEEKQLLEEIATRRQDASPSPSSNEAAPHAPNRPSPGNSPSS